ncbi:hypothetical protein [Actinoplanes rectilineatus]|uniref:hypothetical protein n=1 Tax=Actinoplanes rectilineatus TaxID=113571 RepID=UPI0005F2C5E2|nr:hypothetical protein [Actinoplanes rectilineatus]
MTDFEPITGLPCDPTHPFPAPTGADWADSMEYGDDRRLPGNGMWDRDTTPIWRAVAANLWNQDCYGQHLAEVAADPILTAHTIAVAAVAHSPNSRDVITQLAFAHSGAGTVFAALNDGGQEHARRVVDGLTEPVRVEALAEVVAHINRGFTALRLDVGARFSR